MCARRTKCILFIYIIFFHFSWASEQHAEFRLFSSNSAKQCLGWG